MGGQAQEVKRIRAPAMQGQQGRVWPVARRLVYGVKKIHDDSLFISPPA